MNSMTDLSLIFMYNEEVYAKKNVFHKLVNKIKKFSK